jgi:hypothetical protein
LDTHPVLLRISMSTNDTPAQESAGTTDATSRCLPQHVYLGRDREGYHHHLDRAADAVYRFGEAGTIERRTDLDGEHLDEYLAFVADGVGWDDRRQLATWDVWGR